MAFRVIWSKRRVPMRLARPRPASSKRWLAGLATLGAQLPHMDDGDDLDPSLVDAVQDTVRSFEDFAYAAVLPLGGWAPRLGEVCQLLGAVLDAANELRRVDR
jgi:hypothetical protein